MALMGIDIGTTGCKVVVYTIDGQAIASAYREYSLITKEAYVELDSDLVFARVIECLVEINGAMDMSLVEAISVSAMSDTFTPFDVKGRPLMNSIVSYDKRASAEAAYLEEAIGRERLFEITGMPIHPMYLACKILWLKNNYPLLLENTWKFLCFEEYILWKLGGEVVCSYSMAGKSMLFDNAKKDWADELLDICGVRRSQLSQPIESGVTIGRVSKEIAAITGLSVSAKLVSGGFDQACCALSCNAIDTSDLLDTTGTNEILFFITDESKQTEMLKNNLTFSYHVLPGVFSSYAHMLNAGGAFRWCRDTFFTETDMQGMNAYDYMTNAMKKQPVRVKFLPFLTGMGTPEMDPVIRGTFLGMGLDTDKAILAQSVLEGVTFELRHNIEMIESIHKNAIGKIISVGGATKSMYWLQLKASITGVQIKVPQGLEPGACGAAILAGAGAGVYATMQQGAAVFEENRSYIDILPDKDMQKAYDEHYEIYSNLRRKLAQF